MACIIKPELNIELVAVVWPPHPYICLILSSRVPSHLKNLIIHRVFSVWEDEYSHGGAEYHLQPVGLWGRSEHPRKDLQRSVKYCQAISLTEGGILKLRRVSALSAHAHIPGRWCPFWADDSDSNYCLNTGKAWPPGHTTAVNSTCGGSCGGAVISCCL